MMRVGSFLVGAFCIVAQLCCGNLAYAESVPQSRQQVQLSFAPVLRNAAPAVVNIYAAQIVQQAANPLMADPFFQQFFGNSSAMPTRERIQRSLGSGVLVSSAGLIVTNEHVVKNASEVKVILNNGREYPARILRTDASTDLAVLKIDATGEDLPFLNFADSDALEIGDLVLAIGNPFGVGQTVTMGIVSATGRTGVNINDYNFFIQTDAAVNPGNSGGALINTSGELIGINSAIFSRNGGSLGIGFAIPANMVQTVLAGAEKGGRVVRPWLGAQSQSLNTDLAQTLGIKTPRGALITTVTPKSPADTAGLQKGDVVMAVDGHVVTDPEALRFRIATLSIGSKAVLRVMRGGNEVSLTLPVEAPREIPARDAITLTGQQPLAGVTVANLSPALSAELEHEVPEAGVVVMEISRGSPAIRLGIRPGDILQSINGSAIATSRDVAKLTRSPLDSWQITLVRKGQTLNVVIRG